MSDRDEYSGLYHIPDNYTNAGRMLGGMIELRNLIEACVIVAIVGYPELMFLKLPGDVKIILMTVTLIPLVVFAAIGVNGDSLFTFAFNWFRFLVRRKKYRFRRIRRSVGKQSGAKSGVSVAFKGKTAKGGQKGVAAKGKKKAGGKTAGKVRGKSNTQQA